MEGIVKDLELNNDDVTKASGVEHASEATGDDSIFRALAGARLRPALGGALGCWNAAVGVAGDKDAGAVRR